MSPFHAYLKSRGLSFAEFGRRIGVKTESVRRYATEDRVPTPDVMQRIIDETRGAVTADAFFKIPENAA